MNKKELVKEIRAKLSRDELPSMTVTNRILDAALESIQEALNNGEMVALTGFGTFKTLERKDRKGRNPKTGETIVIPGKRVPGFVPASKFKEMVSNN